MSRPHDRDPEGSVRGSGYFDKSVESLDVPAPEVYDPPAADHQSEGSGPTVTDAATAYLDEFPG